MTPTINGPFSEPNAYYLALITSQYQTASKMLSWLTSNLQVMQDTATCLAQFLTAFDLDTAVGTQLDVLGAIVGQNRTVAFEPTPFPVSWIASVASGGSGYVVGDVVGVVQVPATGALLKVDTVSGGVVTGLTVVARGYGYHSAAGLTTTGGSGTGLTVSLTIVTIPVSPVLDDSNYRLLLKCRVIQNHWDGQIDSLQAFWAQVFPGGSIIISDHQDMTATILVSGVFTSIVEDLIVNGYIVPRPQGVLYNYTLPSLPLFGFDENDTVVAGFNSGKFV